MSFKITLIHRKDYSTNKFYEPSVIRYEYNKAKLVFRIGLILNACIELISYATTQANNTKSQNNSGKKIHLSKYICQTHTNEEHLNTCLIIYLSPEKNQQCVCCKE